MDSTTRKDFAANDFPAKELAQRRFGAKEGEEEKKDKKLFLSIGERQYLIRKKIDPIFPGSSSKAIGITGVRFCIGMYCELNDTDCFVWHAYGHPMDRAYLSVDGPRDADKGHISAFFRQWLHDKLGPATELMKETLILVTGNYDTENWAILRGILRWAGVDDHQKWIQQRMRSAGAFIVEEPGKMDGVRYFPPYEAMRAGHPGNWSQTWERHEEAVGMPDGLGQIQPRMKQAGSGRSVK